MSSCPAWDSFPRLLSATNLKEPLKPLVPLLRLATQLADDLFEFFVGVLIRYEDQPACRCLYNEACLVDVDIPVGSPHAAKRACDR
jgi:hypothetical protein